MGYRQLGRILIYAWLGLVIYLVSTTHGSSEKPFLKVTLPYDGSEAVTLEFNFYSQKTFKWLVDCLCDVSKSTCTFNVRATTKLRDKISFPVTISSDLDDLSTWKLTVDEKYTTHLVHHFVLTRHDSTDSDLKCWKKEDRETLTENPKCSSKPQRVYLGGSRWLEIDDTAETFTYNDDDDEDCGDDNLECTRDCLTTTVPPPADSTERVYNPGNTANNFVDGNTDATMDKQKFSSDPKPVIVGVVVPVLSVLIVLAILLSVILWRCKKPEQAEDTREIIPAFPAFNPGAYTGTEFIHNENAGNEATESGDSQSVLTLGLPPPYNDVLRVQNANTQNGLINEAYVAVPEDV